VGFGNEHGALCSLGPEHEAGEAEAEADLGDPMVDPVCALSRVGG
jgi:hypothetical protein